jgi:two-component system sensor histidine kinase MtrB
VIPPLAVAGAIRHRWRRSLQTRVIVTTLLLSATVSVLLGVTILHQVQRGLLDSTTRSAMGQMSAGVRHAESQFGALPKLDPTTVEGTARAVVSDLTGRPGQGEYDVAMLSFSPQLRSYAPGAIGSSIPAQLRAVVSNQSREAWVYTHEERPGGGSVPALVVGAPVEVPGAAYGLYYVFPLDRDAQALHLVERTMLAAGAALVLLLVGIAALVTRQVVRPVREAAVTAGRLATGRLKERMPVRGEDDLATLAGSFNRMADTVSHQISQLRELSRVQRRFVADVSHELRTPVTTIRMAADLLHDSRADLPPELARSAELLQTQLDRFELLLADLLEISRYDAGAAVLDAEPVDLRQLVERVVEDATPLADRRGTSLSVELPADPVVVDLDSRRIDRALRNLVNNAVEHSEGRPVRVRMRVGETGVAVAVRDHGVGLRPGEASLVFGRFWRADPARARSSGGTGLGLSIALEDVRLHGGWLQAWGEPQRGAVFRMTLPWHVGGTVVASALPLDPDEEPGTTDAVPARA